MPTTLRRLFRERGPGRSHCHTPTDGAVGAKTQASSPPNDRPDFTSIEDKAPPQQQLLQDSVYVPDSRAASLLRSSSKPTTWRQRLLRVSSTRRSGASPPETAAARTERTRARLQSAPDQPVPRAEQPRTPLTPGRKRASTDATPSLKRSVSARSDERRARPGDALPRHDKHSRAVGRQASDPFAALPMLPAWQTDARVPSLRGDESFLRCASSPRTTSPVVSPSIARVIHRDYAFPSMPAPDHGEDGAPPPPGVDAEWDEVRGQAQAKIASWRARMQTGGSESSAEPCTERIRMLPPLSRPSTLKGDGPVSGDNAESCATSLLQQQLLALLTHDEVLAAAAATAVPDAVDRAGAIRRISVIQPPRGDAVQRLETLFRRALQQPRASLGASESASTTAPGEAVLGHDTPDRRGTLELIQSPNMSEAPSTALDSDALCSRLPDLESEQELWRKHAARRLVDGGRKPSKHDQRHASGRAEPPHRAEDPAVDPAQRAATSAKQALQRQQSHAGPPAPADHSVPSRRQQRSVSLQYLPAGARAHAEADAASTTLGETALGTPTVLYSSLPRNAARPRGHSPSGAEQRTQTSAPLRHLPSARDEPGPTSTRMESTPSRVRLWLDTAPVAACSARYAASATATEPSTFERLGRCGSTSPSELTSVSRMLPRTADKSRAHERQVSPPQALHDTGKASDEALQLHVRAADSHRSRQHRRSADPVGRRESWTPQSGTRHVHKLDDKELMMLLRGVTPSNKAPPKEAHRSRGQASASPHGTGASKRGKQATPLLAQESHERSNTRDSHDATDADRLRAHMLLSTWLQQC